MSTSADSKIGGFFADTDKSLFRAEFSVKGRSGVLIENFSLGDHEKEVLFNKGSKFKVESIKHTSDNSIEVNLTEI